MMENGVEYELYVQRVCLRDNGDAKAIIFVDAYPMNTNGEQIAEGYVVAQVILTTHNDVVVAWNGSEGRANPKVLDLVEKAKIEILGQ